MLLPNKTLLWIILNIFLPEGVSYFILMDQHGSLLEDAQICMKDYSYWKTNPNPNPKFQDKNVYFLNRINTFSGAYHYNRSTICIDPTVFSSMHALYMLYMLIGKENLWLQIYFIKLM